jgi:hypothetical protein
MAAKPRHRRRQGSLSQLQSALWAAVSEATEMIEHPRSPKYLKLRAISALSTAAGVYIKLLEVSDLEKRLTRIEALLAERNGHHVVS